MPKIVNKEDYDILLEVYKQKYEHLRHLQRMRATYFNFYIATIGFSVVAFVSLSESQFCIVDNAIIITVAMIWLFSIFTMMRAERWGGHITHDLRSIREIENFFCSINKPFNSPILKTTSPIKYIEFSRPLWNRNRSIETPVSILISLISSIVFAYYLQTLIWLRIIIGLLLAIIPILIWWSEVENLKKRHANCCLS